MWTKTILFTCVFLEANICWHNASFIESSLLSQISQTKRMQVDNVYKAFTTFYHTSIKVLRHISIICWCKPDRTIRLAFYRIRQNRWIDGWRSLWTTIFGTPLPHFSKLRTCMWILVINWEWIWVAKLL